MYILGISALDKESTLTLFRGNQLLYAVSEERLTRVKKQDGFPWLAFEEMLKSTGIEAEEIEIVAYPFLTATKELLAAGKHALSILRQIMAADDLSFKDKLDSVIGYPLSLRGNYLCHQYGDRQLQKGLKHYGLQTKLRRYNHELCHAAAAFYASGFDKALIQVSDWYGTGSSGGIYLGEQDTVTQLVNYKWPNSLGSYYARYTEALGFTPDRHEGKVLGLAAYGDPSHLYLDFLREFKLVSDGSFEHSRCLNSSNIRALVENYKPADIAAALQQTFETILVNSIAIQLEQVGLHKVCLAGGSMANVKLNQRIRELDSVHELFVFPAMSDMGSGYGAACLALQELGISPQHKLENIYLSRDFEHSEIVAALEQTNSNYQLCEDIEVEVAKLLANHKVVGRWHGRMEFGPRALGNRSILCNPSDPNIVQLLNQRLQRTEFMPFAPSVIEEAAIAPAFRGIDQSIVSAQYMTLTFNVEATLAKKIPATVHVDGTARIQVVKEKLNPSFYKIVKNFYELTGIPAVINTSFNIHEEPIVYTPEDAIRVFQKANLDFLAIDNFLVKR